MISAAIPSQALWPRASKRRRTKPDRESTVIADRISELELETEGRKFCCGTARIKCR
jgi:hypothetical protein